jgi:hypothetical protein
MASAVAHHQKNPTQNLLQCVFAVQALTVLRYEQLLLLLLCLPAG